MSQVVVLTGGVGGAKLVLGLAQIMPPERITAIVNTADDFRYLGLAISPDLDTLLYTLAGKSNVEQGWGRAGESWAFLDALRSLGGPDWFALGDADLAVHVLRTARRAAGKTLSAITAEFANAWNVIVRMLPMTDDAVATMLATDVGPLDFQHYFVARRCAPVVSAITFAGAETARPAPGVLHAIATAGAILIAPSNPYLSVDPILAVPGIRDALAASPAKIVAVCPIIGGKAVKGPTAKLMAELGLAVSPKTIAAHYEGVIDAMLLDTSDAAHACGIPTDATDTLMLTLSDRARVAAAALALAARAT